jgi:hypothetical protein
MNEILPRLYVGGATDAQLVDGVYSLLNVMWDGEEFCFPKYATHMKTLGFNRKTEITETDIPVMEAAADWIHERVSSGQHVLVHCAFGMERSPLTVLWYLMRYHKMSLDEAYSLLKKKREEVLDRREWLPEFVQRTGKLPARVPSVQGVTGTIIVPSTY